MLEVARTASGLTILHFLYHGEPAKSQLLNRMGYLRRAYSRGDFNDHEGNIILGFAARSEAIQIVIDGVENVVCF
jgi:hypothetical protein